MGKEFEHKGQKYWITTDNAINTETKETGVVAYVSDYEPTALQWGTLAKDSEGKILLFPNELSALTNANAIKQSEIDSRPN